MSETLNSSPNPNPDPSAWESLFVNTEGKEYERKRKSAYEESAAGKQEIAIENELDDFAEKLKKGVDEGLITKMEANDYGDIALEIAMDRIDNIRAGHIERTKLANIFSQAAAKAKAKAEDPAGQAQPDAAEPVVAPQQPEGQLAQPEKPAALSDDEIAERARREAKELFPQLTKVVENLTDGKKGPAAKEGENPESAKKETKPAAATPPKPATGEQPKDKNPAKDPSAKPSGAETPAGQPQAQESSGETPELDLSSPEATLRQAREKAIRLALEAMSHPDVTGAAKARINEGLKKAGVPPKYIQMILKENQPEDQPERQPFVGVNVKNFQIDVGKYAEQFADGNEEKIEHQRLERSRSRFFKRLLLNIFRPLNHYDRNRSIAIAEGVAQDYNDYSSKDVNAITQETDAFYINKAIEGVGKRRGKDVVRSYDVDKAIGEAQWAIKEYARLAAKVKDGPDKKKEAELKELKQKLRESLRRHIHVDIEAPGNNYFAIAEQAAELVRQGEPVKDVMKGFKMREVKFVNKLPESGKYDFWAISDTLRRLREADAATPPQSLEAAA